MTERSEDQEKTCSCPNFRTRAGRREHLDALGIHRLQPLLVIGVQRLRMTVTHSIIIAVAVLGAACGPRPDTLASRTSDALPVPPPPTTQRYAPPAPPTPPLEPFGRAAYVGGTFGWVGRPEGALLGKQDLLQFILPPDEIVLIPLKDIRTAEYGAKPGRDANRLTTFDGAEKESRYLTLRYADRTGQEQVIVLDLAQKTVDETLRFIEQAGLAIVYQQGKTGSPR